MHHFERLTGKVHEYIFMICRTVLSVGLVICLISSKS